MLEKWLERTTERRFDSRGERLRQDSTGVRAFAWVVRAVCIWLLAVLLLIGVVVAIVATFMHVKAIIDTLPVLWASVAAVAYLAMGLMLMLILHREERKRPTIHGGDIAFVNECLGCGYALEPNSPRAADGCVVCPECGAAWCETDDRRLQPLWVFRTKGWIEDRRGVAVPMMREMRDEDWLAKMRLPMAGTTRIVRIVVLVVFLMAAVALVSSGWFLSRWSSGFAMLTAALQTIAMAIALCVLMQRARAMWRARVTMLKQMECPHCQGGLSRDTLGNVHCTTCKCEW